MTIQDIILEAITIAAILKFLYSLEEFLMARNWLSVKVENCIGPIHIRIKDHEGTAIGIEFSTLADYHKWIKNHITAANKIPALWEDTAESEDEE